MEKMNSRTILAIVLSIGIFIWWQNKIAKQNKAYQEYQQQVAQKEVLENKIETLAKKDTKTSAILAKQQKQNEIPGQEEIIKYENQLYSISFSSKGASIKNLLVKNYKEEGNNITIIDSNTTVNAYSVYNSGQKPINYKLEKKEENLVRFKSREGTKTYEFFPRKYYFKIIFENKTLTKPTLSLAEKEKEVKTSFLKPAALSNIQSLVYNEKGDINKNTFSSIKEKESNSDKEKIISWVSLGNKYFIHSVILPNNERGRIYSTKHNKEVLAEIEIPERKKLELLAYAGPEELDLLKEVNTLVKGNIAFEKNIDFGWFTFLGIPLLKTLKVLHSFVKNWGVAIILLTIIIKLLLSPLMTKSYKSMKEMQKLQPEIKKIREKYKDNKETLNKETMLLMRRHKVNPMGSCFPILLQMPVFFALYRVFSGSVELYKEPFCLWITDLSVMDKFWVLPILMGIAMVLQQKLTPSSPDPIQAKMLMIMPVMFTLIMLTLPAGLNLYFLVNTIFSIGQQYFIQRAFKGGNSVITKTKKVSA